MLNQALPAIGQRFFVFEWWETGAKPLNSLGWQDATKKKRKSP